VVGAWKVRAWTARGDGVIARFAGFCLVGGDGIEYCRGHCGCCLEVDG